MPPEFEWPLALSRYSAILPLMFVNGVGSSVDNLGNMHRRHDPLLSSLIPDEMQRTNGKRRIRKEQNSK